ncbi:hypothetical protein [Nocardioides rubriscoriae]|uniref:hypothetical protein n=1 Tax=Nocardioides rubriscoriae TaxID=642762 RepID=UPI0011DF8B8D|nr:hypothetical protein [Nocardioides rubriscoriae]
MCALITLSVAPSQADEQYDPPSGTWNGKVVYMSRACHDRGSGACITNYGCDGAAGLTYSENLGSRNIIRKATYGGGGQFNLLERGYRVVIGNGLLQENINNSNARNIAVHMPVHSDAPGDGQLHCPGNDPSIFGTLGLYRYTGQRNCANMIVSHLGPMGPGPNDVMLSKTDLGELNYVDAVTCYVEAEAHTWARGVNWLREGAEDGGWSWALGYVIDDYLNCP